MNHTYAISALKKKINDLSLEIKSIKLNSAEPEMTSDLMFADEAITEAQASIVKLQTAIEVLLKNELTMLKK